MHSNSKFPSTLQVLFSTVRRAPQYDAQASTLDSCLLLTALVLSKPNGASLRRLRMPSYVDSCMKGSLNHRTRAAQVQANEARGASCERRRTASPPPPHVPQTMGGLAPLRTAPDYAQGLLAFWDPTRCLEGQSNQRRPNSGIWTVRWTPFESPTHLKASETFPTG